MSGIARLGENRPRLKGPALQGAEQRTPLQLAALGLRERPTEDLHQRRRDVDQRDPVPHHCTPHQFVSLRRTRPLAPEQRDPQGYAQPGRVDVVAVVVVEVVLPKAFTVIGGEDDEPLGTELRAQV